MHITDIYSVIIQNKGYAPGLVLGRRGVSSAQSVVAMGPPPRTLQSPLCTPAHPRSRTPPTRSLHACNDEATLNIKATIVLKIRVHLLRH